MRLWWVADTCTIADPVSDPPSDDAPVPIQTEIQPILPIVHVHDSMMFSEIAILVQIQRDEYYKVYPLSVAPHELVNYSKVFLTSNICKMTSLHHNLIVGGFSI